MLSLNELRMLLVLNARLTQAASLDLTANGYQRMVELTLHREIIKDCIIQVLESSPALYRAA